MMYVRVRTVTFIFIVSLLYHIVGYAQEPGDNSAKIMFYNVENLFDIEDDSLTNDEEFLPDSPRHWSNYRYIRKINNIYKAITAAGEWSMPAIVGFAEVENRKVLEKLVYNTGLSRHDYAIIHEESPDHRGIDVALIYRKNIVEVLDFCYFLPDGVDKSEYSSRSVLYASCRLLKDTVHLFVNHWPSKRGGVLAGQERRLLLASTINRKVDSLTTAYGNDVKIIVMGDFNSACDDQAILKMTDRDGAFRLVDLSCHGRNEGSYKYQGKWEMLDHILVSEGFLNRRKGVSTSYGDFKVFAPAFLLTDDTNYPGMRPFSTWWGFKYSGGYSDHLPVIVTIHK